jgi:acetyl-CoA carboxylase biotin carboxyl carrier protein
MSQLSIKAHVTGTVVELIVNDGVVVSEEDDLIIFESMKMHVPLVSPRAGKVISMLVSVGDVVEEGQAAVLLEVED